MGSEHFTTTNYPWTNRYVSVGQLPKASALIFTNQPACHISASHSCHRSEWLVWALSIELIKNPTLYRSRFYPLARKVLGV
jgi:hypothetical protein